MTKTEREKRYQAALANIPAPGDGCHPALLGVANYAVMAGRTNEEALAEIRAAIPSGRREVSDNEILEAIDRARRDSSEFEAGGVPRLPMPQRRRTVADIRTGIVEDEATAAALRRAVLTAGGVALDPFGADVRESSPVRFEPYSEVFPHAADMIQLLQNLYRPEDQIFIGRRDVKAKPGEDVRTAAEWIHHFQECLARIADLPPELQQRKFEQMSELYPLIMPNPLTGRPGQTKSGDKESWRADSCVAEFKYVVAEFDGMPFAEQGAMLRGLGRVGAKIAAVIYSGGKSCHAWICCDGVTTAEEWRTQVKDGLFPMLAALGVDRACSNPSRLSRLPGVLRDDTGNWQRLLYLAPEGGAL